jgi:predicted nucleotidyltransferase
VIQFRELLRLLVEAQLDFVVVGGLAATIHGVSEPTRDLDVCIVPSPETWTKVAELIRPLNPRYALTPDKRPIPYEPAALASFRNLYVLTDLGRLDFLGEVPPLGSFDAVCRNAETIEIDGLKVRVIALDDLITVKEHVRRPKDLEVAAELRAIRDARK